MSDIKGQKIALTGTTSEIHITDTLNYYIEKRQKYDHDKAYDATFDMEFKGANNTMMHVVQKLGMKEYEVIWTDSKTAGVSLIDHIHFNYGSLLNAKHIGADKISSDVIVDVLNHEGKTVQLRVIGTSLKYSTSDKPHNTIKIHSPAQATFNRIIEDHYQAIFGINYGIDAAINDQKQIIDAQINDWIFENHQSLVDIFDINKRFPAAKGPAYYRPYPIPNQKYPILNEYAYSHIRRLNEAKDPWAVQFYAHITNLNLIFKRKVAEIYYDSISQMLDTFQDAKHRKLGEGLYRALVNVPDETQQSIETIMMDTKRKPNGPDVTMYHLRKSVDKYLEFVAKQNGHKITRTDDSISFRVGPISITVDTRPGRGGAINVLLDKKALYVVGEY